jgi:hypothetical protein
VFQLETKVCSKCGVEKSVTEYHKNGFDRQGNQKYRGYCKECANKRETERYWEKRAFVDAQRTCCIKCGETRSYVLDFHHIDSDNKDFTIGKMKRGSTEVLQAEIDKCVCLCANCHREFHHLEKNGMTLEDYLT